MKKKLLGVFILCLALTLFLSVTAFAAGSVDIVVDSKTVTPGQSVSLSITATGSGSNIGGLSFALAPDDGLVSGNIKVTASGGDISGSSNNAATGTTNWMEDTDDMSGYPNVTFTVTFTVNADAAPGTYTLAYTSKNALDPGYGAMTPNVTNGTITIEAPQCSGTNHAEGTSRTLVPAVDASCTEDGSKAYYICSGCNLKFMDEAGQTPATDLVIPAKGHGNWTTVEEPVAVSCKADGHSGLYKCGNGCGKTFIDMSGNDDMQKDSVETYSAANYFHTFGDTVAAVEPTCMKDGNVAYVTCSVCNKNFDETARTLRKTVGECTEENLEITNVVLPKVAHDPTVMVAMVKATPAAQGTKEYYKCSYNCGTIFEKEGDVSSETTIDKLKFDWIQNGGINKGDVDDSLKSKADADGYKIGCQGYEVAFQVNDDDMESALRDPSAADLAKMDITLPFPEGITKADTSKYDFEVLHKKADGTIETVKFTVTDKGFKLSGLSELSPFAVAWKEAAKQTSNGNKTNTKAPAKGTSPKTGDETNIALWVVLFTVVLTAAVTTVVVAKKKIKSQN